MTEDEILITLQSTPHGGSPRGIGFYSKAANCGRKAVLDEQAKEANTNQPDESEDEGAFAVGTHYHRLMELHIRGQTSNEVWDFSDRLVGEAMLEGLRLYRGYLDHWGSLGQRYGGTAVGTEVPIPATPAGEAKIREIFGDAVTGRIDAVLDVTDPAVAFANTGLQLERGRYLVDFKTAASMSPQHQWTFQFSLQAATYLDIYNMENPDKPALGMIFDVIAKHKQLRKVADKKGGSSYAAYLQKPGFDDREVIGALVKIGKRNFEESIPNPAQCVSGFSPCGHFKSGKCSRY